MNARHFLPLAAALALGLSTLPAQTPGGAAAKLVPATYTAITDSFGFTWDVNASGGIGRGSNCFSTAFTL